MDYRITWSPEAAEDLETIAEYIERDSPFYAQAVVVKILAALQDIKQFPYTGRIVPETGNENIREKFVYSYRLVYQIIDGKILVIAIIHGKRLLENIEDRIK
ncbi:MAG: type II toxin-antitoxin system RelE/ParE family toxin [Candidatus Latescibacteria bacterium]|nr:type II toxin-antitoxin system RelE/ParE family toxin [Candidatus Latescibacterota bacterium]